ncbi:MAG TPA: methylated-DNA--[protein]-cysteine S-methyltransferase [Mariprofundaceae bacterium]|nr:methylated-DNA--[protein]-cysteine S-methyltransferase [Mariprofundaceae bacterium]
MLGEISLFRYDSPLGPIGLALQGDLCHRLYLKAVDAPACSPDHPVAVWLRAYFSGHALPKVPAAPPRTPFQARLREVLLAVPVGQVRTYGELAEELGSGARAVGQALGANPVPILVPCHRVLAARDLGGFGAGMAWKKRLLAYEGVILQQTLRRSDRRR